MVGRVAQHLLLLEIGDVLTSVIDHDIALRQVSVNRRFSSEISNSCQFILITSYKQPKDVLKKRGLSRIFSLVEQECHEAYEDDGGEQSEGDPESVELAYFCSVSLGSSGNIKLL